MIKTNNIFTAGILLLASGAANMAWGARIVGVTEFSGSVAAANGTPAGTLSIAALGGANATTAFSTGSPVGPNFIQTTLAGSSTNYIGGAFSANVAMDLTAGPGTQFNNALAEAISGTVRITNSGAGVANFIFNASLLYSLQTFGPTFASISTYSGIERFNPNTQQWDIIGSTSFGLGTNQSNSACSPACVGTYGGNANYQIAAGSFADIRLRARLGGSASQVADPNPPTNSPTAPSSEVPEPATFALMSVALIGLGLVRRG